MNYRSSSIGQIYSFFYLFYKRDKKLLKNELTKIVFNSNYEYTDSVSCIH